MEKTSVYVVQNILRYSMSGLIIFCRLNIKPAQESDENKKEIFGRNQICLK
jgi:hypothetical protein